GSHRRARPGWCAVRPVESASDSFRLQCVAWGRPWPECAAGAPAAGAREGRLVVSSCADLGLVIAGFEDYMTRDEIWAEAGDVEGGLCVGCLEERLGRVLTPEDFLPLPVHEDDELDSVRLRTRKGSGGAVEALYRIATGAVLDLGVGSEALAEGLGIDGRLLEVRVDSARLNRAALAEIA